MYTLPDYNGVSARAYIFNEAFDRNFSLKIKPPLQELEPGSFDTAKSTIQHDTPLHHLT